MAHCFVKQVLLFFLVGAQKTGLLDIKNVMFLIVDNYAINRTNLDDWFRIWPWDKTSFTEGKGMEPNTCLTSHHRSDWEGTLKETCIYNGANIFFWDVSDEVKAVLKEENIQSGSQTLLYRFYDFGQRRILKGTLKQVNKWGWERVWECFSWGAGLREGGVQLLDDIRLSSSVVFHQSIDSSFNLPFFSPIRSAFIQSHQCTNQLTFNIRCIIVNKNDFQKWKNSKRSFFSLFALHNVSK